MERSHVLIGGWQTDRERAYVALSRSKAQTDIYTSREDLGNQGMNQGAIERLGEAMSESNAQQASIATPEQPSQGATAIPGERVSRQAQEPASATEISRRRAPGLNQRPQTNPKASGSGSAPTPPTPSPTPPTKRLTTPTRAPPACPPTSKSMLRSARAKPPNSCASPKNNKTETATRTAIWGMGSNRVCPETRAMV